MKHCNMLLGWNNRYARYGEFEDAFDRGQSTKGWWHGNIQLYCRPCLATWTSRETNSFRGFLCFRVLSTQTGTTSGKCQGCLSLACGWMWAEKLQSCSRGFLSYTSRHLAWQGIVMAVELGFHGRALIIFSLQSRGWRQTVIWVGVPTTLWVIPKFYRACVAQELSFCSSWTGSQGENSHGTYRDMSGVPRALGAAGSSVPFSFQCTQKFNMREQFPSRSLLLPLSLLSMTFLPCCSSPLQCLRLLLLCWLPQGIAACRMQSPWGTAGCWELPIAHSCCGEGGRESCHFGAQFLPFTLAGSGKSSGPHPAWTESWITWDLSSKGCKQPVEECCAVHQTLKDTPAFFSLSLMDSWVKGAVLPLSLLQHVVSMLLQVFRRIWTRKPCWSLTPGDVLQREEKRGREHENCSWKAPKHSWQQPFSPQEIFKGGGNDNFLWMPFGLGVGTVVSGFQEKEAWQGVKGSCSKLWSCCSSSGVSAGGQQRTGSGFEFSTACCRPPGVLTAPLASPWWSGSFFASL